MQSDSSRSLHLLFLIWLFRSAFWLHTPQKKNHGAVRGRDRDCVKLHRLGNKAGVHFQRAGKEQRHTGMHFVLERESFTVFSILLVCASAIFSLPCSPSQSSKVLQLGRSSKDSAVGEELAWLSLWNLGAQWLRANHVAGDWLCLCFHKWLKRKPLR